MYRNIKLLKCPVYGGIVCYGKWGVFFCLSKHPIQRVQYLTVDGKLILWQESICLVKQKISSDEFFEAPILALYKSVCTLTL